MWTTELSSARVLTLFVGEVDACAVAGKSPVMNASACAARLYAPEPLVFCRWRSRTNE
jgi:hypothetical protein